MMEALDRAIHGDDHLNRMAGAIAHHFNNQLQVVLGNLEMALGDPQFIEKRSVDFLTDALHSARRASEVSSLMLTCLGHADCKREPLDLSEICRRNIPLFRATMPKGVYLEFDLPSTGPFLRANANQIQKVLSNLIANVCRAGGESPCTIHLSVKTMGKSEAYRCKRFPADWPMEKDIYACLELKISGCDIATCKAEDLFDPFFSLKSPGRGMGLAMILGVVRTYEGGITMESVPDNGSIFRLFFPAEVRPPIPPCRETVGELSRVQKGGMVLLVEDEELVRKVSSAMLSHLGYSVLEARDGIEAVELFRRHREEILCVLCDLIMPRMNGWETLAALHSMAPGFPVILASGYIEVPGMEKEHPQLPLTFLSKPYRPEQLSEAIRHALATC